MKYLYLDDEQEQQTRDFVELLEHEVEGLEIIPDTPKSFGDEIKRLKRGDYDGLILDLRLDEKSEAEYRAFTLAQELRTRATEGKMNDIPMVLVSTDPKLKKSYIKDSTGHDLFDRKYLKGEGLVDQSAEVAKELVSLAKGYGLINEIKTKKGGAGAQLQRFFLLSDEGNNKLDVRLKNHFGEVEGRMPTHEYARFLMTELIETNGPLVDVGVLAARLGVDMTSIGFDALKIKFEKFKYKGPFGDKWERWWWHLIEAWWNEKTKSNLPFLEASERVENLERITKVEDLSVAQPLEPGYSSKFWTICRLYKKPLDPFDGILVEMKKEPLAWQESLYMSIKAALSIESKAERIFPHQLEKDKVKALAKSK